jgi:hypothetical protein
MDCPIGLLQLRVPFADRARSLLSSFVLALWYARQGRVASMATGPTSSGDRVQIDFAHMHRSGFGILTSDRCASATSREFT